MTVFSWYYLIKNKYLLNTSVKLRPDLVSHFSDKSLEKSGFVCKILIQTSIQDHTICFWV